MSHDPKVTSDRYRLGLAAVLLVAVLIRLVYFVQYKTGAPYYTQVIVDSYYYDLWAQRVADGKGYGPMPYYMAPLYPFLLGLLYKVIGHNLPVVYALQMALGVTNVYMVYLLARKLFGYWPGILAMLFMTTYGPLVYLEPKIMTETLAIALNLAAVLLFLRALDHPGVPRFLAAGIVLGLAADCRPNSLITAILLAGWLVLSRHWRRREGFWSTMFSPLALGIVIAVAPVTARNYVVGRDLVLISSNGGIVFAQGNHERANGVSAPLPGFSGSIGTQREEEMARAEAALGHPVKQSESSAYWFRQGLSYIRDNPGDFLWLLVRKAIWSLHDRESRCSYNPYLERLIVPVLRFLILPFPLLAGLALFGYVRARAERAGSGVAVLGLYVVSVFLSLVVFSVSSRYRVPAVPALAVFAGFGTAQLAGAVKARSLDKLVAVAACLISVLLISLIPYPVAAITAEAPANLGISYMSQGRLDEAIRWFRASLRISPRYAYARNNLGIALQRKGMWEQAEEQFREAIAADPNDADVRKSLATALYRQGKIHAALVELEEALRINPKLAAAHFQMGDILAEQRDANGAIRHFRAGLAIEPGNASAHVSIGVMLDEQGKVHEAIREYREALSLKPDHAQAHNNLAVALYEIGEYAGAWKEVALTRKYGAEPNPGFLRALSQKMPEPGR